MVSVSSYLPIQFLQNLSTLSFHSIRIFRQRHINRLFVSDKKLDSILSWPGRVEIEDVAEKLAMRPREDMCNAAARLYRLALQRNFTRGRRVQQVHPPPPTPGWVLLRSSVAQPARR